MKKSRRTFFKKAGLGMMALGGAPTLFGNKAYAMPTSDGPEMEETFKVAVAGWTFVKFELEPALEMTEQVGVNYLCIKDFHLPMDSTADQIAEFHKKLADRNIKGYGVGPIYMKTQEDVDKAFDYAERVGVKLIVGVPLYELLPYVEKKVKEYDFKYAIHIHGPEDELYPALPAVYEQVKDLDVRVGMCHDIGYSAQMGLSPAEQTLKYSERIHDMHIKDMTTADAQGVDCELGRGAIDFPALIKALRKVKYSGMCSMEYEKNNTDPLAGLAESVGYFKGIINAV